MNPLEPVNVVVSQDFFPKVGGAHLFLYEVYRRWRSPVTVLTRSYAPEHSDAQAVFDARDHGALRIVRADMAIEDIDLTSGACRARIRKAAALVRSIGGGAPTTVHCLRAFPEGLIGLAARIRRPLSTRLVVFAHGEEVLVAQSSRQLRWIARLVYRFADVVIANSRNTEALVKALAPSARVVCVHPGVDPGAYVRPRSELDEVRRSWGWPDDTIVLSTVARMEERKNQSGVIAALAALRAEGLPLAYVCAGDGEERAKLQQLAADLGVAPWVRFPGTLSDEEKIRTFAACDLHVMPSVRAGAMIEGFGIVFLEAAAAGVPSICGNVGGQAEAVADEETGLVVDGANPAHLRGAIRRLAIDSGSRARMGQAAALRARAFDWANVSVAIASAASPSSNDAEKASGARGNRFWWFALLGLLSSGLVFAGAGFYYGLRPAQLLSQTLRVLLTPMYAAVYDSDRANAAALSHRYWVGDPRAGSAMPQESWKRLEGRLPGFSVTSFESSPGPGPDIPFVYEQPSARYLSDLRTHFELDSLVAAEPDEYQSMLRLANWLGTRWDHGTDTVPGGTKVCEPVEVIEDGEGGARYWCEIAARTTVQAATSLGWPARLITASRDGYTWEHAVAELWSNQFDKWFVVDTDFNVVYEHEGVPLSAFELSQQGEELRRNHTLTVRRFAPPKPSLPLKDMVPFYEYVHVDMRNDWCSRPLPRASPAGGDRATWWSARPTLPRVLTANVRVDDPAVFDWKLNHVALYASSSSRLAGGKLLLGIGLSSYSPTFRAFEVRVDGGKWQQTGSVHNFVLAPGAHTIEARVLTESHYPGRVSQAQFSYAPRASLQLTNR